MTDKKQDEHKGHYQDSNGYWQSKRSTESRIDQIEDEQKEHEKRRGRESAMNKFHARKTVIDGITFDSLAEARRYQQLKLMQAAGEIYGLQVHASFQLQEGFSYQGKRERPICYVADFSYCEPGKETIVVEDVKGGKATQTEVFRIKRKWLLHDYKDVDFRIVES